MIGGFSLGQATPCLKNFVLGKEAAIKIYSVLDRVPLIQEKVGGGEKIEILQGNFVFKNVVFNYPSKPDVQILKNISLNIEANKKTALVGESGSGKSTILQLLERFYDPL